MGPRAALALSALFARARAFTLNALFADGMVLQAGLSRAAVYGGAAPGEAVSVRRTFPSGAGATYNATGDANGAFFVALPEPPAGEDASNVTLVVANATTSRTIAGAAYGEVIVCSGQSTSLNAHRAAPARGDPTNRP